MTLLSAHYVLKAWQDISPFFHLDAASIYGRTQSLRHHAVKFKWAISKRALPRLAPFLLSVGGGCTAHPTSGYAFVNMQTQLQMAPTTDGPYTTSCQALDISHWQVPRETTL